MLCAPTSVDFSSRYLEFPFFSSNWEFSLVFLHLKYSEGGLVKFGLSICFSSLI